MLNEYESAVYPGDIMAVCMARLIRNGDTVFHGVSSHLPMIAVLLAKKTHAPDAVHLNMNRRLRVLPAPGQNCMIRRLHPFP